MGVAIPDTGKPIFEEVFSRHKERIFNLFCRLVKDRHEAEDLTIEAFLRAYKNYPRFRSESQVYTWLYRISINLWNRHSKKAGRMNVAELDAPIRQGSDATLKDILPDPQAQGNAPADKFRDKEAINRAIESLPAKYREIVVLGIVGEKTYSEIAAIVRISTSLVGIRLLRAREMLRKKLKNLR